MKRQNDRTPANREKDESYGFPGEDKGYDYEDCQ